MSTTTWMPHSYSSPLVIATLLATSPTKRNTEKKINQTKRKTILKESVQIYNESHERHGIKAYRGLIYILLERSWDNGNVGNCGEIVYSLSKHSYCIGTYGLDMKWSIWQDNSKGQSASIILLYSFWLFLVVIIMFFIISYKLLKPQ